VFEANSISGADLFPMRSGEALGGADMQLEHEICGDHA
jgi:hypothetical protein